MNKYLNKYFKYFCYSLMSIILTFILLVSVLIIRENKFINTYGKVDLLEPSEKIGTISLYSSPIKSFSFKRPNGHSWIYIQNTSTEPFTLNGIVIQPNNAISMGTTAHYNISPNGIWFNIEGYNKFYKENISVTTDFYQKDLDYLEIYLENHNRWTLLYNCATFTCGIWNNLSSREVLTVRSITPVGIYNKLQKSDLFELNKPFYIYNESVSYQTEK